MDFHYVWVFKKIPLYIYRFYFSDLAKNLLFFFLSLYKLLKSLCIFLSVGENFICPKWHNELPEAEDLSVYTAHCPLCSAPEEAKGSLCV